jgi:hypothetical protein
MSAHVDLSPWTPLTVPSQGLHGTHVSHEVIVRIAQLALASLGYDHRQWQVRVDESRQDRLSVQLRNRRDLRDDLGEAAGIASSVSSHLESALNQRTRTSVFVNGSSNVQHVTP